MASQDAGDEKAGRAPLGVGSVIPATTSPPASTPLPPQDIDGAILGVGDVVRRIGRGNIGMVARAWANHGGVTAGAIVATEFEGKLHEEPWGTREMEIMLTANTDTGAAAHVKGRAS